jgi:FtsX-like permease family
MHDWKAEITSRLPDPSAVREDVLEEMAQHIEDRYGALVRSGLPDDRAYAEVLEELTDSEVLTAMLRPTSPPSPAEPPVFDGSTGGLMTGLGRDLSQDLRYGVRALRRSPRFTLVSILALALGIGVNTVVFTAYKALVARPIDARDPSTLVNIAQRLQSGETMARFSYPDFEAYRDGLRSFSGVIAFSIEQLTLSDANGVVRHRRSDTGALLSRLGLLTPPPVNTEIVTTFVVSENYFAVRDTRGVTLDGSDTQQVYVPLPMDRVKDYPLLLRTSVDPTVVVGNLAPVIAQVDPALPVTATTLQAMLRRTDAFLAASFSAAIASSISLFGLVLASMGIYSTVSYDVVLRTREVGIRMAIGAQTHDILLVVMRASLHAVLVGLAAGVVLAVGAARLLRGVLYGVGAVDAISFAAASLLFVTIALAASWLPSRRAMRIDPLVALRDQ